MAEETVSIAWNNEQFNQFISAFAEEADIAAEDVVKKMAFDLLSRIVLRMPVATGRARAGWSAAGTALGVTVPTSGASRQGDSGYGESFGADEKAIFMTNRVNYVVYLEFGSSRQAPLGMVRVSMLELQSGATISASYLNELWENLSRGQRYARQARAFRELTANIPTGRLAATVAAVRAARRR